MYDLRGKVALVTGARGQHGLGRAIAVRLAQEGADVAVNGRPTGPRDTHPGPWAGLSSVVAEIRAMGRKAMAIEADVSSSTQVQSMITQVLHQFGHIDILVNNAAAAALKDRVPVVDLEEDAWDLVQRVNSTGTFLCCKYVARAMIARGQGGKIINLSSTSGRKGHARYAAYCASKFAVVGFSQSLALELGPHGINVNVICPGLTETERIDSMAVALAPEGITPEQQRLKMIADTIAKTPLRRMGQPDDVADVAAFLASAESDFLTGVSITVAGGVQFD